MTNMDIQSILKQTEELTLDEDKLSLLSDFIGNHFNDLTTKDFIQLLIPLVDITQRIWEQNPVLDTLSDYTIALTKLAENYIKEEQSWLATPLLVKTEEILRQQPDTEDNAQWKYNTYYNIGTCFYTNERRMQAKDAFQQALRYATAAGQDTEDCENYLHRIDHPTLKYDPVEDSEAYLSVIDEVERKLYDELKDESRPMGFCFRYWAAKRAILEQYGITWRSPKMMNPRVMFD